MTSRFFLLLGTFAFLITFAHGKRDLAFANTRKPVGSVAEVKGDVRYRAANALNWVELKDHKHIYTGDLVFTRKGGYLRVEYLTADAAIQLPEETLFRFGERPPSFTKLRRKFGSEADNVSAKGVSGKANPFERMMVRSPIKPGEEADATVTENGAPPENEIQLGVLRTPKTLHIEFPSPNSTFVASTYPAYLSARVGTEFRKQKLWLYLWSQGDLITPLWVGYANGEFSNVPIAKAGKYQIQMISDDDSMMSEPVDFEYTAPTENVGSLLQKLKDSRNTDHTFSVE
jgi:hypothetical protein